MSEIIKLRGFKNLGNTCYMNSLLQALLSSSILNNSLLLYIKGNPECVGEFSPLLVEYCRILADHVDTKKSKLNEPSSVYSPTEFKAVLSKDRPVFEGYRQHDSHDLMMFMMDEFIEKTKNKFVPNLIKRLCHGKYKQYMCCDECRYVSINNSAFFDVQLPIPGTANPDLEDCFKNWAKYETMTDDNKWDCPKCIKKVVAYRRLEIDEVPDVAMFMFNRFIGSRKLETPIKLYPNIALEQKKMKLIATINHYGTVNGGHYTANVTREVNGAVKWFKANDSAISPILDESFLNDSSVYVAIYQVVPE
jgi:ubiquitin C-terminal hydrolase